MIAAMEGLDLAAATWLAERDPALVQLPAAVAATEPDSNLHDVQWTPGQGCRLAYRMDVEGAEGATFVAVDLNATSWSRHDFRSDPALPGLSVASDPAQVVQRLTPVVHESILDCRVRPVRYRPGARCVLRYEVRTASGSVRYYAKVFPKSVYPDVSGRATRVAAAARSARVRVGSVVAEWPGLSTTVARAAEGRSASAMMRDATVSVRSRIDLTRRLGRLLAEFHTLRGVSLPRRTASDHLRAVTDLIPAVALMDAELADRLRRLVDRLGRHLPGSDGPQVLIHGGFRLGQVVVDAQGSGCLIDLDGVSNGAAGQDLGNALSHLSWQAIKQPSQDVELELIGEALVAGYESSGVGVESGPLAWWQAASAAQLAGRRFRRLEIADWALVPALIDVAESRLGGSATRANCESR